MTRRPETDRRHTFHGLAVALAAALLACRAQPASARFDSTALEPAPAAAVAEAPAAPVTQGAPAPRGIFGDGDVNAAQFARRMVASLPRGRSIGVLPLVYYRGGSTPPYVPEFGIKGGELIARHLRQMPYSGDVLTPNEMYLALADMNVDGLALSNLEAVRQNGDRFGVDVVVFGTATKHQGRSANQEFVRVELFACDVATQREIERESFDLSGRRAFDWTTLEPESAPRWLPSNSLPDQVAGSLDDELRVVRRIVAQRIVRQSRPDEGDGLGKKVYVAPADASQFVVTIARLRAAQRSYLRLKREREEHLQRTNEMPPEGPVDLDGQTFASFQQATDYLFRLQELVLTSPAAQFCRSLGKDMVGELRDKFKPRAIYNDLAFVRQSDPTLMEAEIAVGGLVDNQRIQNQLREEGVDYVIAPRIERVGEHYRLRADIYNLATNDYETTAQARLDARFTAELAALLDVRDVGGDLATRLEPVPQEPPAPAAQATSWADTYEQVSSGVAMLAGFDAKGEYEGHGTAFLVRPGVLMTNSHVVEGLKTSGTRAALFTDGTEIVLGADWVIHDDPFWDVALIRIDKTPAGAHVFEFAPKDRARAGLEVAVVGHPKGAVSQTIAPGFLMTLEQLAMTSGPKPRPTYMYTCPTRGGNSGSPVLLRDGRIVAVHNAGAIGEVRTRDANAATKVDAQDLGTELTGFAMGAPGHEAERILREVVR